MDAEDAQKREPPGKKKVGDTSEEKGGKGENEDWLAGEKKNQLNVFLKGEYIGIVVVCYNDSSVYMYTKKNDYKHQLSEKILQLYFLNYIKSEDIIFLLKLYSKFYHTVYTETIFIPYNSSVEYIKQYHYIQESHIISKYTAHMYHTYNIIVFYVKWLALSKSPFMYLEGKWIEMDSKISKK